MSAGLGLDLEAALDEHACAFRVALLPVGATDTATFRGLADRVRNFTALDLFAITHGKRRGKLRLRFVEAGGGPSDWDELYPQRRVRAVVGLCHFPCERNLSESFRSFMQRVEDFPSTTQVRCLVFEPPEESSEIVAVLGSIAGGLVLFFFLLLWSIRAWQCWTGRDPLSRSQLLSKEVAPAPEMTGEGGSPEAATMEMAEVSAQSPTTGPP